MFQQSDDCCPNTESAISSRLPILARTLDALAGIELHLSVVSQASERAEWLDATALNSPRGDGLSTLMDRFKSQGLAPNRKAASASLLLRFGWAGGFAIGAYLVCGRVPVVRDYVVSFSSTMLLQSLCSDRGFWQV
jgi:hypothetical protein